MSLHLKQGLRRSKFAAMWVAVLAFGTVLSACGSGKAQEATSTAVAAAALAEGQSLYAANCSRCHGTESGGNIKDIPPPHNANGHTWHHPDQQLADIVLNGLDFAVEGQPTMPAFKDELNPEQVQAILTYIKTWWTDEQRAYQATVTAVSER